MHLNILVFLKKKIQSCENILNNLPFFAIMYMLPSLH